MAKVALTMPPSAMIAAISPPIVTFTDAFLIIGIFIPAAVVLHAFTGAAMVRKARATDPASAERVKKGLWSFPSLLLAWLPFLFLALGMFGCSFLRDAGYLIFPWPMVSLFVLFGLAQGLCQFVMRRRLGRLVSGV